MNFFIFFLNYVPQLAGSVNKFSHSKTPLHFGKTSYTSAVEYCIFHRFSGFLRVYSIACQRLVIGWVGLAWVGQTGIPGDGYVAFTAEEGLNIKIFLRLSMFSPPTHAQRIRALCDWDHPVADNSKSAQCGY
jgi:hypothetical protein